MRAIVRVGCEQWVLLEGAHASEYKDEDPESVSDEDFGMEAWDALVARLPEVLVKKLLRDRVSKIARSVTEQLN